MTDEHEHAPLPDIEWSGVTTAYPHKHDPSAPLPADTQKALHKVWLLDVQWSDCPVEVEAEVQQMWRDYSLANDHSVIKTTLCDLLDEHPLIAKFILEQEPSIGHDEKIFIHWWW